MYISLYVYIIIYIYIYISAQQDSQNEELCRSKWSAMRKKVKGTWNLVGLQIDFVTWTLLFSLDHVLRTMCLDNVLHWNHWHPCLFPLHPVMDLLQGDIFVGAAAGGCCLLLLLAAACCCCCWRLLLLLLLLAAAAAAGGCCGCCCCCCSSSRLGCVLILQLLNWHSCMEQDP